MEMFTIFLCIVIGHAFGDLQGIEISENDLKAQKDAKSFLYPNVRDADHLDQSPQSKDVQMTVQSGIFLDSILGDPGQGRGAEGTKRNAEAKEEKPNLQESDRPMDNKGRSETQQVDTQKDKDNAKPEGEEKRKRRETFECEADDKDEGEEAIGKKQKALADWELVVEEPTEEGLLGIVEGSSAPPGEEGDAQRKEEFDARPFCNGTPKVQMTEAEIKQMVDSNNEARRREHTADAIKLVWDPELAHLAQQKANTCLWNHSMTTHCHNYHVGQNLFAFWTNDQRTFVKLNVTFITFSYVAERYDWNWDTRTCPFGKLCGHWRLIVGASQRKIGCGLARCRKFWWPTYSFVGYKKNVLYSVCNYVPSEYGFSEGEYCTQCNNTLEIEDKGWRCEDKLCVACDPEKETGCTEIYKSPEKDSEGYQIVRGGPDRKVNGDVAAKI